MRLYPYAASAAFAVIVVFAGAACAVGAPGQLGVVIKKPAPPDKPLLQAAAEKDEAAVSGWIASGKADLRAKDKDGNTPLLLAVRSGAAKAAAALLAAGADQYACDAAMRTALHVAAAANNVYELERFHRLGLALDARDTAQETPLHVAAKEGRIDAVKALVRLGAEKDAVISPAAPLTPLELAGKAKQWAVVHALVELGVPYGEVEAAALGDLEKLKASAERNPDALTAAKPLNGKGAPITPMQAALMAGQAEACEFLMAKGIKMDSATPSGLPMLFAVATTADPAMLRFMSAKGVDINQKAAKIQNQTLLHYLAIFGKLPQMEMALTLGADPNAQDALGQTSLYFAAIGNKTDLVAALLKHGARVDLKDKKGTTVLDTVKSNPKLSGLMPVLESAQKSADAPSQ